MKELSIFIDESGDFGEYEQHAPYYIISMVFHDQDNPIDDNLKLLEARLSYLGYPNHCIHVGPIIRGEGEYHEVEDTIRRKIVKNLLTFIHFSDIKIASFHVDKRHMKTNDVDMSVYAAGQLGKQISAFIRSHYELFLSYDLVKVYYDNGQIEVNKILSTVFNMFFENVEFRKVLPSEYRLFQVADLVCTLTLTELKLEAHSLSKSESYFFGDEKTYKNHYYNQINKKLL